MATSRQALVDLVAEESARPVAADAQALAEAIRARAGGGAAAVLLYGAGLWQGASPPAVWDFYVLVDSDAAFDRRRLPRLLGRVLPPNVYVLETTRDGRRLRAKCAVVRTDRFRRAAAGMSATPQIWARFAQPCRIVHARDAAARETVAAALAEAVVTFHRRLLPLVGTGAGIGEFWRRGLAETYARELRSEARARGAAVHDAARGAFEARTRAALALLPWPAEIAADGTLRAAVPRRRRMLARLLRPGARAAGKAIALLRLMKAALTFEGGVDYLLWKVERHSGVRAEASAFQRRHPLIAGWPLLWRLYRRGGFR